MNENQTKETPIDDPFEISPDEMAVLQWYREARDLTEPGWCPVLIFGRQCDVKTAKHSVLGNMEWSYPVNTADRRDGRFIVASNGVHV